MKRLIHKVRRYFSSKKIKKKNHPSTLPQAINLSLEIPRVTVNFHSGSKKSKVLSENTLENLLNDFKVPDAIPTAELKIPNPFFNQLYAAALLSKNGWVPSMRGFLKVGTMSLASSMEEAFIMECRMLKICPVLTAISLQHYFENLDKKKLLDASIDMGMWQGLFFNRIVR